MEAGEVKLLVQGHTAAKGWNQVPIRGTLAHALYTNPHSLPSDGVGQFANHGMCNFCFL